jgi:hypothetical protein
MGQHHDCRTIERSVVAFARPLAHLFTIGRIAKDDLGAPILLQAVLLFREKIRALCVGGRGARVECEVELLIEELEEVGRRGPLFGAT